MVDLWRLKGLSDRLVRASGEEEGAPADPFAKIMQEQEEEEPCKVQFFAPELYFDDFTYDRLHKANDSIQKFLLAELEKMRKRLDLLGGGNWKNLLFYALKYISVTEVGETLMDALPDGEKRKQVENAVTHGVWDQMDERKPALDELEIEFKVCEEREDRTRENLVKQNEAVNQFNERKTKAERELTIPNPPMPPESDEEPEKGEEEEDDDDDEDEAAADSDGDNSTVISFDWDTDEEIQKAMAANPGGKPLSKAKIKELKRKKKLEKKMEKIKEEKQKREKEIEEKKAGVIASLIAEWEEKAANAEEEVKVLAEPLKKLEVETMESLDDDFKQSGKEAKRLEAELENVSRKVEEDSAKAAELEEQVAAQEQEAVAQREQIQELTKEVAALPPPDPRVLLLKKLTNDYQELKKNTEKAKQVIIKVSARIRDLRFQIKDMYKQLGWEYEDSDDDGDDSKEQPYWLRKRLAQKTAETAQKKFDEHLFLNAEDRLQSRRVKKREKEEKLRRKQVIMDQLNAKRRSQEHNGGGAAEESSVLPFTADAAESIVEEGDSVERAIAGVRRRLNPPRDEPPVAREGDTRQAKLARLQHLQEALEVGLRSCAGVFGEMLPEDGLLAELRPRLRKILDELQPKDASETEEERDEMERQLEDSSAALHGLIGEAVGLSDPTQPSSNALRNSLDFGELRKRLSEVRASQRQLQSELRTLAEEGRSKTGYPRRSRNADRPFDSEVSLPLGIFSGRISSNSPSPRPAGGGDRSPLSQTGDLLFPRGKAFEGLSGPLAASAGQGTTQKRKGRGETAQGVRSEVADFGFRPDGTGEESLENWSLFKVSKGRQDGESGTPAGAGTTSTSFRSRGTARSSSEKFKQPDEKEKRLQRVAADCDFREYMSQMQQSSKEMWRSSSTSEIEIKKGPSLPELVKKDHSASAKDLRQGSTSPAAFQGRGRSTKSSPGSRGAKARLQATAPPDFGWSSSRR
mmetsp:Transcript_50042/g.89815  ORF Transcript_50042/g.89815 Transcript_50042/m.89815 type:complete len:976 (+) Transcript_50042:338-3265(+)